MIRFGAVAGAVAAAVALTAGCGGSSGHPHTAAAILRADGYTVTTVGRPGQAAANLGVVSRASGVKGSAAEQVLVLSSHPTAPVCKPTSYCTPAGLAGVLRVQDRGTRVRVDGQVVRITGLAATFRKDGLPL